MCCCSCARTRRSAPSALSISNKPATRALRPRCIHSGSQFRASRASPPPSIKLNLRIGWLVVQPFKGTRMTELLLKNSLSSVECQSAPPALRISNKREATTPPPSTSSTTGKNPFPLSHFPTVPLSHFRSCQYKEYCISSTCFFYGNLSLQGTYAVMVSAVGQT